MKNILQRFFIVVFPLTFLLYYGSFKYLRNYQIRKEKYVVERGNVYIRNKISDDLSFIRNELSKIKEGKNNIPKQSKQKKRIFSNNEPVERIVEKKVNIEDEYPHKPWKHQKLDEYIGEHGKPDSKSCAKKEHIYFLKTSKTGGTTFANILQRFGYSRPGTNFLMGECGNGAMFFANGEMPFNLDVCFVGRDFKDRPKFDISFVHMKYNQTAVNELMQPDTFKVSILRDPVENFISSWRYYNGLIKDFREMIMKDIPVEKRPKEGEDPDYFLEIEQFLTKPVDYLSDYAYSHAAHLMVMNPQLVFFGVPSYLLKMNYQFGHQLVDSWLHGIASDFDHILILEDLDRSLAILMLKLCWTIEDVAHLKLNTMKKNDKKLSSGSIKRLRDFNWGDIRLYNYFKAIHDHQIKEIGENRINDIARRIEARANQISSECLETIKSGEQWIQSLKLKPEKMKNQTCFMMTKDMGPYIHEDQVTRWKQQFPNWRMSEKDLADMKFKGSQTPEFCSTDKFAEFLTKREKNYRAFLKWKTNEYDILQTPPEYLEEFLKPTGNDEVFRILN
ncbi:unnamed protein product [Oikopleura dioica]|uniref:Sulfotransferase n=1 Tax=Oikopleura dioica TaxID=34765 RepID=E4YUW6_OIKDI|nr:unnamed protein product [Oikopleura dioica]